MKQEVLALIGCIAATASTTSVADVLPKNLIGLNLGEIRSSSFLNQPFKGVIPFLFTSYENSKKLSVKLAPQSVFNKVGAERHPILNKLNFQVTKQNGKPVILISSDQPINLPFLNFILEIQGQDSLVYQDYTVLLDPESKTPVASADVNYIDMEQSVDNYSVNNNVANNSGTLKTEVNAKDFNTSVSNDDLLRENGAILLANLSSNTQVSSNRNLKYRVKSGDSLFKIAKKQNIQNASLKKISGLIFQKNPRAFIRGNANRLKKGALLNLPTATEINGFEIAHNKPLKTKSPKLAKDKAKSSTKAVVKEYTVVKGDSLSKISKKLARKDMSFSKMMSAIYENNPTAFINNSRDKLKAGVKLNIPSSGERVVATKSKAETATTKTTADNNASQKSTVNVKVENKVNPTKVSKFSPRPITNINLELTSNQYQIKAGDSLSYITNKIGYKEVPFAKMLKAIHAHNPDSFEQGKMSSLIVGSIITLPPLSDIEIEPVDVVEKPTAEPVSDAETTVVVKDIKKEKPVVAKTEIVASKNLTKRIRELRKELNQAKESLSDLKGNLSNKETLLEQKNIQLESLNTLLTNFDKNKTTEALTAVAIKTKAEKVQTTVNESPYKPKSKAEMAKLKRDQLLRKEKTSEQLKKIKVLQDQVLTPKKSLYTGEKEHSFKDYKVSSLLNFTNTNYAYLTMALLLTLLLIRYRRELYSYTYSAINYDQPKYYPIPDSDTYELKEKNINYHDPKMDEDPSNYELLSKDQIEGVSISPHLVEATENIFETSKEAKQIQHCEHLVTELFNDLSKDENKTEDNEWENIEKVCDTYIENIKDTDIDPKAKEEGSLLVGATDFNHMMSDLLESLDKVDKSVKRNHQENEDELLPSLLNSNNDIPTDNHDRI